MAAPTESPHVAALVPATMASQALLVVLSPTIVAVAEDYETSVGAVGQARSITAGVAIAASIAIASRADAIGVRALITVGSAVALAGCAAVAVAPGLATFLAAHALVGAGFACLLSAGFAGVAAFAPERRPAAMGYVAGAQGLAWIVVNPVAGILTESVTWRAAQAAPAAVALVALLAARWTADAPAAAATPRPGALLGRPSARRWIVAELIAYAAWTSLLTFAGALFIERNAVPESTAGWLLAAGAAAYFLASTRSGRLLARVPRRQLVALCALAMAALLPIQLGVSGAAPLAAATFCLVGLLAGVRTPASGGLGLDQLPEHPGAMMAARTGTTQLGYLVGAVVGGAVIAAAGYGTLGVVLAVGMAASAALILGVDDPSERRGHRPG